MVNEKFTKSIDDLGRIWIPKEIRKKLFGNADTTGMEMNISLQGDNIILEKISKHSNKNDSYDIENICIWTKNGYNYTTSCDGGVAPLMRGYNYCPYCGKRLEIK